MYFSMENTNIFQGNIIIIQVFHLYLHNLLAFSPTIYKHVGPGLALILPWLNPALPLDSVFGVPLLEYFQGQLSQISQPTWRRCSLNLRSFQWLQFLHCPTVALICTVWYGIHSHAIVKSGGPTLAVYRHTHYCTINPVLCCHTSHHCPTPVVIILSLLESLSLPHIIQWTVVLFSPPHKKLFMSQ